MYDGYGNVKGTPVNVLIPEAYPHKRFQISEFVPSGARGYLNFFLPPFTSRSPYRRKQQTLALIAATGEDTIS